jgi:aryl-alcohol dehydrogenase-like predicted oxidoreductase
MKTNSLGSTGLVVSPMGLGLAALGRPGYINLGHAADLKHHYDVSAMEAQTHTVLDAAWSAGVRYFDAARSYGRSEEFLSSWLKSRAIPPDQITIGSKWGYTYTAGWKVDTEKHEVKDHSLPVLQRQWSESSGFLGKHLKLYQVHSVTLESGLLHNREVLNELARIKEKGVKIGLTLSGPRQAETLERALEVTVSGGRLFDCVQATWNLLETSTGPALHAAHAKGMGVIVKEGLANGRLTERNSETDFTDKRRKLDTLAERLHTTIDGLALVAILAQPWVDIVLSGAATVEQLASNLAALNLAWDASLNDELREMVEPPEVYWATRARLSWN